MPFCYLLPACKLANVVEMAKLTHLLIEELRDLWEI